MMSSSSLGYHIFGTYKIYLGYYLINKLKSVEKDRPTTKIKIGNNLILAYHKYLNLLTLA